LFIERRLVINKGLILNNIFINIQLNLILFFIKRWKQRLLCKQWRD